MIDASYHSWIIHFIFLVKWLGKQIVEYGDYTPNLLFAFYSFQIWKQPKWNITLQSFIGGKVSVKALWNSYANMFSKYGYNPAFCRILEKCGFELEGTLRKNAVKNGVVVDMKMYSILKEWIPDSSCKRYMSDSYGLARLYANTQLSVSGLCILCDAVIGLDWI